MNKCVTFIALIVESVVSTVLFLVSFHVTSAVKRDAMFNDVLTYAKTPVRVQEVGR